MKLEVRELLGAAYPSGHKGAMLTHAVTVDEHGTETSVLCTRVDFEHLADKGSLVAGDEHKEPTCKTCAAKWRKWKSTQ